MSYINVGGNVCSDGAGLRTMVTSSTPTGEWASHLVIVGLGFGMVLQLLYIALQAILD